MESIVEANKESYYLALQRTQKNWRQAADWSPWLHFFLQCLQRQKCHLEIKIEREKLLNANASPLAAKILELLQAHRPLRLGEIKALTNFESAPLKKALAQLVKEHRLSIQGRGRASRYWLLNAN